MKKIVILFYCLVSAAALFAGGGGYIAPFVFSPDGSRIIKGSENGNMELWDVISGQKIKTFLGVPNHPVYNIYFNSNGSKILSESGYYINLWDTDSGNIIRTFNANGWVYNAEFNINSSQILSNTGNNIIIWDAVTGREIINIEQAAWTYQAVFSPDSSKIMSCGDGFIKLWDITTGSEVLTIKEDLYYGYEASFNTDGSQIIAPVDNTIKFWDAATGREIRSIQQDNPIDDIIFNADGSRVLVLEDFGRSVRLLDTAAGSEISIFSINNNKYFSLNVEGYILSCDYDMKITFWDAATGREIRNIKLSDGS